MITVEQIEHAAVATPRVVLRRATSEDRPALLAMYADFEPKAACLGLPPREHAGIWLDVLQPYPNFVIEVDGRMVAHGALCHDAQSGEVAVFVHQDYRGAGLGKKTLAALIEEGRRLNLRRVWGVTELDNVAMLRLAHMLGFTSQDDPAEFSLEL